MLFNVYVQDTASTASRPLRILMRRSSWAYDYKANVVTKLSRTSVAMPVADYITTSAEVDKLRAIELARRHQWNNYQRPYAPPLMAFTPAPTPTPALIATEIPLPINVASPDLPLDQRITTQLNTFLKEQSKLALDIMTSVSRGKLTNEQGKEERLKWVKAQQDVLNKYYPKDAEAVQNAVSQWDLEYKRVQGVGKFQFEQ